MKKRVEDLADIQVELMASCLKYFPNTGNFLCTKTYVMSHMWRIPVPQTPLISLSQVPNSKSTYADDTGALHNCP